MASCSGNGIKLGFGGADIKVRVLTFFIIVPEKGTEKVQKKYKKVQGVIYNVPIDVDINIDLNPILWTLETVAAFGRYSHVWKKAAHLV